MRSKQTYEELRSGEILVMVVKSTAVGKRSFVTTKSIV